MKTHLLSLALAALPAVAAAQAGGDLPQDTPKAAVAKARAMLAAGDAEAFVRAFVVPADLAKLEADGAVARVAHSFKTRKAPHLAKVLEKAATLEPALTEASGQEPAKAVYTFAEPVPGEGGSPDAHGVTFERHEGLWYLANERPPRRRPADGELVPLDE